VQQRGHAQSPPPPPQPDAAAPRRESGWGLAAVGRGSARVDLARERDEGDLAREREELARGEAY